MVFGTLIIGRIALAKSRLDILDATPALLSTSNEVEHAQVRSSYIEAARLMKLLCTEWQRHCYNRRTWQLLDRYRKSYCLTQWRLLSDSPLIPGDSSTLGQAQDEPTFNAKAAKDHGPLPLPPMMDPVKLAARYKYRAPKRRSTSLNLTKLQRELKNNPYGEWTSGPFRP